MTIWRFKCRGKLSEKAKKKNSKSKSNSKCFQFSTLQKIKGNFFRLNLVSCLHLSKYLISLFNIKFVSLPLYFDQQHLNENLIKLIWCLFHHNIRLHKHIIIICMFQTSEEQTTCNTSLFICEGLCFQTFHSFEGQMREGRPFWFDLKVRRPFWVVSQFITKKYFLSI